MMGDLFPQPLSPLTATAGAAAQLNRAWTRTYAEAGLLSGERCTRLRQRDRVGRSTAVFGGHVYLNAALVGKLAVQSTQADPLLFARHYAGGTAPNSGPINSSWASMGDAQRTKDWIEQVLSSVAEPVRYREAAARLDRVGPGRGRASESGEEIARGISEIRDELGRVVELYVSAELSFLLSAELVDRIARDAGNEGLSCSMFGWVARDVLTPSEQLWNLAAQVGRSERLALYFGRMLRSPGSARTTPAGGEADMLRAALAHLRADYGHLGPGGWELSEPTWGTDVASLLNVVDQLRDVAAGSDGFDMDGRLRSAAQRMNRDLAAVRRTLRTPRARYLFERSFTAARTWARTRQKAKWIVSRLQHEQRLAVHELGKRHVDSGLLDQATQIAMLGCAEIMALADGSEAMGEEARMRGYDHAALSGYEPPTHTVGPPLPVVQWPSRTVPPQSPRSVTHQSLTGVGASPGKGSGKAHVIRAGTVPSTRFQTGDVLVVDTSNSFWASLVPGASAVVVEQGSVLGDLALACRALGVPCVVSVGNATRSLPGGAVISVDGSGGLVRRTRQRPPPEVGTSAHGMRGAP